MVAEIERPASSPRTEPSTAMGVRKSTAGTLQDLIAEALPETPDGGAWERALFFALEQATRAQSYGPRSLNPYDDEKHRVTRLLLDHYRGALRRREEQRA